MHSWKLVSEGSVASSEIVLSSKNFKLFGGIFGVAEESINEGVELVRLSRCFSNLRDHDVKIQLEVVLLKHLVRDDLTSSFPFHANKTMLLCMVEPVSRHPSSDDPPKLVSLDPDHFFDDSVAPLLKGQVSHFDCSGGCPEEDETARCLEGLDVLHHVDDFGVTFKDFVR